MSRVPAHLQIASNIKRERTRLGWTQERLALMCGLSLNVIRACEGGDTDLSPNALPSRYRLARLARALGVTIEALLPEAPCC